MRTLLVGLDNGRKEAPHRALWPVTEKTVGNSLMKLINEHTPEDYRPGAFVLDFARTNMYPMRRAPNGKGKTQADADAMAHVLYTAGMIDVSDIVLIGARVVGAFNLMRKTAPLHYMESALVDMGETTRRVWAVPYPDSRYEQYRTHQQEMGKLLASLRNRTMIPYSDKMLAKEENRV